MNTTTLAPAWLKPQDTVAIISTARKVTVQELAPAVDVLKSWGLEVCFGDNLFAEEHQFAGSDAQRLSDLQWAINHPDLKAVFFARGGYGTTRVLDQANFAPLLKYPKWFVGFSDITALHCHLNKLGIQSIHASMPFQFGKPGMEPAINSLRKALFGEELLYKTAPHPYNVTGHARGKVVGGNLSILSHIIGTSSEIDTRGCILFLEDLDEYLYHIDRLMLHLQRAGKLQHLAGLVVGHMSDMKDNAIPFGKTAYEIVQHYTAPYNYPVCYNFPVGHEPENLALICGRKATLEVSEESAQLRYDY